MAHYGVFDEFRRGVGIGYDRDICGYFDGREAEEAGGVEAAWGDDGRCWVGAVCGYGYCGELRFALCWTCVLEKMRLIGRIGVFV